MYISGYISPIVSLWIKMNPVHPKCWLYWLGVEKTCGSWSSVYPIFLKCCWHRSKGYILIITFIFVRFHRSSTAATPAKLECDIQYVSSILNRKFNGSGEFGLMQPPSQVTSLCLKQWLWRSLKHCSFIIAKLIVVTGNSIMCSTAYSCSPERKYQGSLSASLKCGAIHWSQMNSHHKG